MKISKQSDRKARTRNLATSSATLLLIASAQVVHADEISIGFGLGTAPEFPGSDEYELVPIPSLEWKTERFSLRTRGPGLELDLSQSNGFSFGPIIQFDFGREDLSVSDYPEVANLPAVDSTAEFGAFASMTRPLIERQGPPTLLNAGLELVQAIDGHDGYRVETEIGLIQPSGLWTFIGSLSLSYTSEDYNQAYFGVTQSGSVTSGLPEFNIGNEFSQYGANLVVSRNLNESWSVTGIGQYARFTGDVADSPVVDVGSDDQVFLGLIFSYQLR